MRRSQPQELTQLGFGQAGQLDQPPADERNEHRRCHLSQIGARGGHQRCASLGGDGRMQGRELGDQELRGGRRPLDQRLESRFAALPHEIVGIFAVGQEQERARSCRRPAPAACSRAPAMPPCVRRRRRRSRTPPDRSAGTAFARAPAWSRCRAWRPRIRRRAAPARRRPCSPRRRRPCRRRESRCAREEAVELAALREQRRLRRVQVFGLALAQHAPAEADHVAAAVVDREHDAVAKAVVALAAVAVRSPAPRFRARGRRSREHGRQRLPVVRRIADAEARGDFAGQAASASGSRWRAAHPSTAPGRTSRRGSSRSPTGRRHLRARPDSPARSIAGTSSPPRCASSSTASGKGLPPYSIRKPIAVPCAPQPKQ